MSELRLSPAGDFQVRRLGGLVGSSVWCHRHEAWNHMPYLSEDATYNRLAGLGVVEKCHIEDGCSNNGYRLTAAGRAYAKQKGWLT